MVSFGRGCQKKNKLLTPPSDRFVRKKRLSDLADDSSLKIRPGLITKSTGMSHYDASGNSGEETDHWVLIRVFHSGRGRMFQARAFPSLGSGPLVQHSRKDHVDNP